jgi:putative transposase
VTLCSAPRLANNAGVTSSSPAAACETARAALPGGSDAVGVSSSPISAPATLAEIAIALRVTRQAAAKRLHDVERTTRVARGAFLYALAGLPADVVTAVRHARASQAASSSATIAEAHAGRIKHQLSAMAMVEARERSAAEIPGLSARAKSRIEVRAVVLRMFAAYHAHVGGSVRNAQLAFARVWRSGELAIAPEIAAQVKHVSASSLARWQRVSTERGGRWLAGRYGNRKGDGRIDRQPAIHDAILGLIRVMPHIKAERVHEALRAKFRDALIETTHPTTGEVVQAPAELPSLRSVQRWMAEFRQREQAVLMKNANPDKYRSTYVPAFGNASAGIERLNQVWEMDSTPADVMTTDGRCAVIGVIDVYSRRLKLLVSKTSRAVAVGLALRRALIAWGVPEAVRMDNGSDYVSKHVTLALSSLGIEQLVCRPFSPDEKPFIERALGTFLHDIVELQPGFIGHNVAERKAIEARKSFAQRQGGAEPIQVEISARRLQEICDQWCEHVYAHRPHAGLAKATPAQAAAAWPSPVRRIENERVLDVLLAEAGGLRRITNKGVRIGGLTYIAPELGPCVGENVFAFHDPDGDLGRVILWRQVGAESEFLCVAECPEVTGVSRAEVSAKAKALAKMETNATLATMKARARRYRSAEVAQLILDDAIAQHQSSGALPEDALPHMTSAIAQAAIAIGQLTPRDAPLITELPEGAQARVIELENNYRALDRARQDEEREKDERFRRWLGIKDLSREQLDDDTREWLAFYTETAEFHARLTLFEGFGPQHLETG